MNNNKVLWGVIGVFLASFILFGAMFRYEVDTDINTHALSIRDFVNGTIPPPANFLYYLVVYAVALFRIETTPLLLASQFVLAAAVAAKYYISQQFLAQQSRFSFLDSNTGNLIFGLVPVLVLILFNLPPGWVFVEGRYYLGQIPPNVWHNSTTIFLMPFALLLFIKANEQLENPTTKGLVVITVLCILNIWIKPSYIFVFFLVYPLMLLRFFGLKRHFWLNLIPLVVAGAFLILMFFQIYKLSYGNLYQSESSVVVAPFLVWKSFSNNILVSLLLSLAFPLIYLMVYPGDVNENRLVQFSGISYIIALIIFSTFAETGDRMFHGNFFWQTVVCSYVLFLVVVRQFIEKIKQHGMNWKNSFILAGFTLHVLSGIGFLIHLFTTKSIL